MSEMLEEIKEIVAKVVQENHPEMKKEIEYDVEIYEYGIDSVSFVSLSVYLEDKYEIEFEDEKLDIEIGWTVRKLAEYVNEVKKEM